MDERLVITQPFAIMAKETNKIGNPGVHSCTKDIVGIDMLLSDIEASRGVLPSAAAVGLDWTGETLMSPTGPAGDGVNDVESGTKRAKVIAKLAK